MLKDIQVTLYEIFGYLMPGTLALCAACTIASFWTDAPRGMYFTLPWQIWFLVFLAAYYAGHLVQALGNVMTTCFGNAEERCLGKDGTMPRALVDAAEKKIESMAQVQLMGDPTWLYRTCEELLVQGGSAAMHDVYVYREGFYRGSTVGFFLLGMSLFLRGLGPQAFGHVVSRCALISVGLLILMGCLPLYQRFTRFADRRVTQTVLAALLLEKPKSREGDREGTGGVTISVPVKEEKHGV